MEEEFLESYLNYEFTPVKIKVLKNYSEVSFCDKKYGPFKENSYIEIPRGLAKILAEEGITEFPLPKVTLSELKRILFFETKNKELKGLDWDFYLQVKDLIYVAENKIINEDPREIKKYFGELCLKRLEKILSIVYFIEDYKKILPLLTNEEKYLFIILNTIIKKWYNNLINADYLKKV